MSFSFPHLQRLKKVKIVFESRCIDIHPLPTEEGPHKERNPLTKSGDYEGWGVIVFREGGGVDTKAFFAGFQL